jgi:hypothetical protein
MRSRYQNDGTRIWNGDHAEKAGSVPMLTALLKLTTLLTLTAPSS